MKKGFTMIELIFVIVILGILAAVAIPRLAATRDDATAAAVKTDIGTAINAVPSWYQGQKDFVIANAINLDTNQWKPTSATSQEYTYTDGVGDTVVFRVVDANDTTNALAASAVDDNATFTYSPWFVVEIDNNVSTSSDIVNMLTDDMGMSTSAAPMAGKELAGNHLKNNTFKNKAGALPAFTMVELIFVIVILGILAAVAIPRLAANRDDAVLVKGKSQVSAIRSGIAMQKSRRMLQGDNSGGSFYPPTLETAGNSPLFNNGILEYGLSQGTNDGSWKRTTDFNATTIKYNFYLDGTSEEFTYTPANGSFDCDHTNSNCQDMTE